MNQLAELEQKVGRISQIIDRLTVENKAILDQNHRATEARNQAETKNRTLQERIQQILRELKGNLS